MRRKQATHSRESQGSCDYGKHTHFRSVFGKILRYTKGSTYPEGEEALFQSAQADRPVYFRCMQQEVVDA